MIRAYYGRFLKKGTLIFSIISIITFSCSVFTGTTPSNSSKKSYTLHNIQFTITSARKEYSYMGMQASDPSQDILFVIDNDISGDVKLSDFKNVEWGKEITILDEQNRLSQLDKMLYPYTTEDKIEKVTWVFIVSKTTKEYSFIYASGKIHLDAITP